MSLQRTLIVVGVVAGHMLLLSWLWTVVQQTQPNRLTMPNSQGVRSDHSPTIVYLLEPPAPAVTQSPPDQAHHDARLTRAAPTRDSAAPLSVQGDKVSNAAALSSSAVLPQTTGETPAEVPEQLGLNLILSRQALKSLAPSLAASSPFRGRLPATVEGKIAEAAAETGPWTEEVIDHDHVRFRRGTTCITLERPEIAKIDPFSDWVRNLPWAGSASECH